MTEEKFNECVDYEFFKGIHYYHCKKLLWSVAGADEQETLDEAKYFFGIHWEEGEYD